MSEDKNSNVKKRTGVKISVRLLIALVLSVAIAFLGELVFNIDVLRLDKSERGRHEIDLQSLSVAGVEYKDGALIIKDDEAAIAVNVDSPYVRKFEYDFEFDHDFPASVKMYATQQMAVDGDAINIMDRNNITMSRSEMKLEGPVHAVHMFFNHEAKGLKITGMCYDNSFNLSGRRMLAVGGFAAIVIILILFSDLVFAKIEYAFLTVGFITCIAMVFTFPTQLVSWDETYHFTHSYRMGFGAERIITPEIKYFGDENATSSLMYPVTEDEFDSVEAYMDSSNIYDREDADNTIVKSSFGPLSNIGHIASAVGMSFARLLRLPLSDVYKFGKLFNMLLYILVTFFAIKRAAVGKRILALIALMPTTLFLASVYSYDATLNAFAFLGISYLISELVERDKLITWKSFFVILISFIIVSGIKMVYAPLLLLLWVLPKEKFKDKKTRYIMKYGIFVLCIAAVLVMIVPTLLDPSRRGDSRGGDTDAAAQLKFILRCPVAYTKILLMNIFSSAADYTVGNGIFASMAHYSNFQCGGYIPAMVVAVTLTDEPKVRIGAKKKALMAGILFVITCFIWTALYISFTPVGSRDINGVQGRYFIPIVFLTLLLFNTDRIKTIIPEKLYNAIVIVMPMLLTYGMVAYKAIAYCM